MSSIRLRKPGSASRAVRDITKRRSLTASLSKLSERVSVSALKATSAPAKSRFNPPASSARTKLTVNIRGNLRGMHAAGDSEQMRKVRSMRRFYNKKMPQLQCSACAFASSCPQFKAGYVCAFLPFLNSHRIDTSEDLVGAMRELAATGMRRMHLATLMETLSGGSPSLETTEALSQTFMQLKQLHDVTMAEGANVTLETEDGSLISRIFGGLDNLLSTTREAQLNPVEVIPEQLQLSNPVDIPMEIPDSSASDVNQELIQAHTKDELDRAVGKSQYMPVLSVSEINKP